MRFVVSIFVLCIFSTTTANSFSDTSMINMNGFHVGLGIRFKPCIYDQCNENGKNNLTDKIVGSNINFISLVYHLSGELGYTFMKEYWIAGIKVKFQYDDAQNIHAVDFSTYQIRGIYATTVLLAGIKISQANAAYLTTGYSSVWRRPAFRNAIPVPSDIVAGIGWRYYFVDNIFIDLSYDCTFHRSKSSIEMIHARSIEYLKKVTVNGITATINYFFNM